MTIIIVNGSGRAMCQICKEKIEVGEMNQVVYQTYLQSERCHRSCITNYEKIKMAEALDG